LRSKRKRRKRRRRRRKMREGKKTIQNKFVFALDLACSEYSMKVNYFFSLPLSSPPSPSFLPPLSWLFILSFSNTICTRI
jgi:hypothetical protein